MCVCVWAHCALRWDGQRGTDVPYRVRKCASNDLAICLSRPCSRCLSCVSAAAAPSLIMGKLIIVAMRCVELSLDGALLRGAVQWWAVVGCNLVGCSGLECSGASGVMRWVTVG